MHRGRLLVRSNKKSYPLNLRCKSLTDRLGETFRERRNVLLDDMVQATLPEDAAALVILYPALKCGIESISAIQISIFLSNFQLKLPQNIINHFS
jgi:hypothetical protein